MDVAAALDIPKSQLGAVMDSGASRHFCPDKSRFNNYREITSCPVKTADGHTFEVTGMSNVTIELLNGPGHSKVILKDAVYSPNLAFTLISVNCLDKAKCSTLFGNGMCKIINPLGTVMGTIPATNGLY